MEEEVVELQNDNTQEEDNRSEANKEYNEILEKYQGAHSRALFEYCFKNNIPFVSIVFSRIQKNDEELKKEMPEIYINSLRSIDKYKELTFFDQIVYDNFEKIYSKKEYMDSLSEDDKRNRQVVIDVFAYDPFAGESESDKPQLYRDLAGMSNEAMRKDVAKQKAAISIVRSYGNIEKYQRKVAEITANGDISEETQKQLDQYLTLISKIQANINQTAEKNNFTVKGIGSNGRGMLSDVMVQIEERGIDEGVTNFYDIATSNSIEEVANISMKAQLNQVALTKTDYADILNAQVEIVKEAQKKVKQATEALRLAKEKIKKQALMDELAADYKKKGISEKEIEDFLKSELKINNIDEV